MKDTLLKPETPDQLQAESGSSAPTCSAIDGVKIFHEHGFLCFRTEKGWLLWSCKLEGMSENGESLESIIANFSPQNAQAESRPYGGRRKF